MDLYLHRAMGLDTLGKCCVSKVNSRGNAHVAEGFEFTFIMTVLTLYCYYCVISTPQPLSKVT